MLVNTAGMLILLLCGMYGYEKAIQKYDPLLRKPWEWGEEAEREQSTNILYEVGKWWAVRNMEQKLQMRKDKVVK